MPDTAQASAQANAPAQHRFPCSACGADLRFDPKADALVCDHCGHTEPMQAGAAAPWGAPAIRELDFAAALRAGGDPQQMEEHRVLVCASCGAQVEVAERVTAADCPFCASPMVADAAPHRQIRPGALAPFALPEDAARAAMTRWLGRLWFAPSGLTQFARKGRRMDGIYVPHWTFDAATRSRYSGQRGTVYYTTRTVTRNGQRVTEQVAQFRWTPVRGRVARAFDDVLVLGSRALPKAFTDALPPWDLTRLVPYAPEYLAGLQAEAYTVQIDEAFHEARAAMDRAIERDVRFDIGGDRQRITALDTDVDNVTYKHVLLPVWVAAYRYGGRSYRIVINGQTGRVQGERPYSRWKIALAVIAGALIAGAVGYAIAMGDIAATSLSY